jgi:hypothetical protein
MFSKQQSDRPRPQSPFIEHRRLRLVDPSQVPAAAKSFSPPWAEADLQLRWSSEYLEQYGFDETWYTCMRRGAAQVADRPASSAGQVQGMTADSLLLPWNPTPQRGAQQRGGAHDERLVSEGLDLGGGADSRCETHR